MRSDSIHQLYDIVQLMCLSYQIKYLSLILSYANGKITKHTSGRNFA